MYFAQLHFIQTFGYIVGLGNMASALTLLALLTFLVSS